ncbi:acyltransferase [Sciscionella marina]|uniref:acyltransferase n=1 Tax=Sciscionella marina TaxID=508770 RepID=UPI00036EC123|nr:acyltransferase [Sciscionella marina]
MSAPTTALAPTGAREVPSRPRSGHLHQIDMVRVLAFSFVILAHVVNGVNDMADPDVAAVSMSMHFTRSAFFFLTALVLVYGYRDRPSGVFSFWRKRIGVVAVPYVVWSAIYTAINAPDATLGDFARALLQNLITGGAMYQLYFLVVTIQFYLVFPLFLAVLRAMRRWPVLTLSIAIAFQFAYDSFFSIQPAPVDGFLGEHWQVVTSVLPSYLIYFVIGGVVAMHLEVVTEWTRKHFWAMLGFAGAGLIAVQINYYANIGEGMHPFTASNPLQPSLMIWCVPAVLAVYAIGVRWADRRQPGSVADKVLQGGTLRAFGIFLAHPLVLSLIYDNLLGQLIGNFGFMGATTIVYLLGVAGSVLLVELVRRTPFSTKLIGRPSTPLLSAKARNTLRSLGGLKPTA